jgi:hypothetical protein
MIPNIISIILVKLKLFVDGSIVNKIKMELKTIFTHVTKSKHTLDVVKSAMQKYARRGDAQIMFTAVTEMDVFKTLGVNNPKVKAIRTNMINRLKIILFEDVSFSQLSTFVNVINMITAWEADRSNSELLMKICCEISGAKKLRMPSHLRNAYGHGLSTATKEDFLAMLENGSHTEAFGWMYNNEQEAVDLLSTWKFAFDEVEEAVKFAIAGWKRTKKSAKPSERLAYLVVPFLWILHNIEETPSAYTQPKYIKNYEKVYETTNVTFEEFVYDMHTRIGKKDKKFFVEEGALVFNEDEDYLDEKLKESYTAEPVSSKKKGKQKMVEPDVPTMDLGEVELITDGVCGSKLPCGIATIKGKKVIVKPMPKSMNYGADYEYVDDQKEKVGLKPLNIVRVKSEKAITGTKKQGFVWKDEPQIFVVMKQVKAATDLGKCKDLLTKESKFKEALKIRLFNGVFRTSDNIIRNILVDDKENLYAIDENDIFGKRKTIFNKLEIMTKSKLLTKDLVMEILGELNLKENKQSMIDELKDYGLDHHATELEERIDEYESIVLKELKMM